MTGGLSRDVNEETLRRESLIESMLALGVENTTRTRGGVNIAFVLRRDGKSKVAGNQSPAKTEPDCEPNATRFLCR